MTGLCGVATKAPIHGAAPPQGAAIAVKGSHTDQDRHLLMAQGAQFWDLRQHGARQHRPDARNAAQQVRFGLPHRTALDGACQVVVEGTSWLSSQAICCWIACWMRAGAV